MKTIITKIQYLVINSKRTLHVFKSLLCKDNSEGRTSKQYENRRQYKIKTDLYMLKVC